MSPDSDRQRREVLFEGRVQGVGFRFTTQRIATHYDVSGFVRNLADGRVRLVAEGDPAELDSFLEDIQSRMSDYIRHVELITQSATGEFEGFLIR